VVLAVWPDIACPYRLFLRTCASGSLVATDPRRAAGEESGFLGGVPPSPLTAIAQPKLLRGGGDEGMGVTIIRS